MVKVLFLAAALAVPVAALAANPAKSPAGGKTAAAKPSQVLPWIEDDYSRAVAEARARKVPMFVESWAPW